MTNATDTQDLLSRIFEMDRAIRNVLPAEEEFEWTDAGMHVNPKVTPNTLWRDCSFQIKGEEEECVFSYSTDGEVMGVIHPRYLIAVMSILNQYKRTPEMVQITNLPASLK